MRRDDIAYDLELVMASNISFVCNLRSPLVADALPPLSPDCELVQFMNQPDSSDHQILGRFLENYPDVVVRFYGTSTSNDLEFLQNYANQKKLRIELLNTSDWTGLRYLSDSLTALGIGQSVRGDLPYQSLGRFKQLTSLNVERQQKYFGDVSTITQLERIGLRSMKLPDLKTLATLIKLKSVGLILGSVGNIDALGLLPELIELSAVRVRGLSDFSVLRQMNQLKRLTICDQSASIFPSLDRCQMLRRVDIQNVKGIEDFAKIAAAPMLTELFVFNPHVPPENFKAFSKHPTLRAATVAYSSKKCTELAQSFINVPPLFPVV